MIKQRSIDYGLLLVSLILYYFSGFVVKRYDTFLLFSGYFGLFFIYAYIVLHASNDNLNFWCYASILFRILLLFAVPNLSDDFYRFIWDGRLLASGYHPFAEVPSFYIQHHIQIPGISEELFTKLNSPDYFTIYPPLAQFIFWLSVKLSPHSIYGSLIVMKCIIVSAEIGSVLVIRRLLVTFNFTQTRVLLYALNPLVILELSGNIHLEALVIFLLLLSLHVLQGQKILLSAIFFSLAICVKLIPLIFLAALFPRLGWKKALQFYLIVLATCAIVFLPLWDKEIIFGFQNSISYYFRKFEFNASLYYLIRGLGYWVYGFNIIQIAGWVLGVMAFVIVMIISMVRPCLPRKHGLFLTFTLILLTFFLFTTTLHPWYITTLLALSIFTEFRFALLWTGLIFLTYTGYSMHGFQENLWITLIEYISVLGYLAYELLWKRKFSSQVS